MRAHGQIPLQSSRFPGGRALVWAENSARGRPQDQIVKQFRRRSSLLTTRAIVVKKTPDPFSARGGYRRRMPGAPLSRPSRRLPPTRFATARAGTRKTTPDPFSSSRQDLGRSLARCAQSFPGRTQGQATKRFRPRISLLTIWDRDI